VQALNAARARVDGSGTALPTTDGSTPMLLAKPERVSWSSGVMAAAPPVYEVLKLLARSMKSLMLTTPS